MKSKGLFYLIFLQWLKTTLYNYINLFDTKYFWYLRRTVIVSWLNCVKIDH
jgi:hypothetical protein